MNHTTGSGRSSRNSQGICNATLQPTMSTTPVPETPSNTTAVLHTPIKNPWTRDHPSLGNNSTVHNISSNNTPMPMPIATGQTPSGRSTYTMH